MAIRSKVFIDVIAKTEDSKKGLLKFAKAAGVAAAAAATIGIALKTAFDLAQYSAKVKQTSMAFKSIAEDSGAMANDIIDNMRRMSGETISELDMMLAANKASLLGIPVDHFDELMAIARASATATGGSVQQMFEDIVTGIGRASPMILDNLGITVKIGKANEDYAKSIGKTVKELTDQEKKQAMLNAVLVSGDDIIRKVGEAGQTLTDVERWQQVTAAAADWKAELGMRLLPAMGLLAGAVTDIMKQWTEASKAAREYKDLVEGESTKTALEDLADAEKELVRLHELDEKNMARGRGAVLDLYKEKIELAELMVASAKERIYWESVQAKIDADALKAKGDDSDAIVELTKDQQSYADSLKALQNGYKQIEERAKLYGDEIDVVSERSDLLTGVLDDLIKDGFTMQGNAIQSLLGIYSEYIDEKREIINKEKEELEAKKQLEKKLLTEAKIRKEIVSSIDKMMEKMEEQRTLREEFDDLALTSQELEIERINERKDAYIEAGVEIVEAERWAQEEINNIIDTATEERRQQIQDQIEMISGPFVDAYSDAFGSLGETLITGGDAFKAFREAFKETIAGMLNMLGKELVILAIKAFIPIPGIFNPVGGAAATAGAAAAFTAAGAVRAMATGGEFTTSGPEMIMVGDNPGGRERVKVDPFPMTEEPTIIHNQVFLDGQVILDYLNKASANGQLLTTAGSVI